MSNHNHLKGFTLVEISIVLVIIGLIITGVLKGKEMIDNSKMNKIKQEIDGVLSAIYVYQDRYNALPGDDSRATARFGSSVGQGDGDGVIEGNWNSNTASDETNLLWVHLQQSNLLLKPNTQIHAFGGKYGYENAIQGMRGDIFCFSGIKGNIAEIIDNKYDDGNGATGSVRSDANAREENTPGGDFDRSTVTQCFNN